MECYVTNNIYLITQPIYYNGNEQFRLKSKMMRFRYCQELTREHCLKFLFLIMRFFIYEEHSDSNLDSVKIANYNIRACFTTG